MEQGKLPSRGTLAGLPAGSRGRQQGHCGEVGRDRLGHSFQGPVPREIWPNPGEMPRAACGGVTRGEMRLKVPGPELRPHSVGPERPKKRQRSAPAVELALWPLSAPAWLSFPRPELVLAPRRRRAQGPLKSTVSWASWASDPSSGHHLQVDARGTLRRAPEVLTYLPLACRSVAWISVLELALRTRSACSAPRRLHACLCKILRLLCCAPGAGPPTDTLQ